MKEKIKKICVKHPGILPFLGMSFVVVASFTNLLAAILCGAGYGCFMLDREISKRD